jgi:hypothetical protein
VRLALLHRRLCRVGQESQGQRDEEQAQDYKDQQQVLEDLDFPVQAFQVRPVDRQEASQDEEDRLDSRRKAFHLVVARRVSCE